MLKFVKQLTDFQYHRLSFAKCTQLERSPGTCGSKLLPMMLGDIAVLSDKKPSLAHNLPKEYVRTPARMFVCVQPRSLFKKAVAAAIVVVLNVCVCVCEGCALGDEGVEKSFHLLSCL